MTRMTKFFPVALGLWFAVFAAVLSALMVEKKQGVAIAIEISEVVLKEKTFRARSAGLAQANEDLRERLETLRTVPLPVGKDQGQQETERAVPLVTGVAINQPSPASIQAKSQPEPILSEEENARQKEEERKAWRKRVEEKDILRNQELRDHYVFLGEFFGLVDPEGLSPDYQEAHKEVFEALKDLEQWTVELTDLNIDEDRRYKLNGNVFVTARDTLVPLMKKQREMMFNDYAQFELGLTGEQASQLIDYIKEVNEITSLPFAW